MQPASMKSERHLRQVLVYVAGIILVALTIFAFWQLRQYYQNSPVVLMRKGMEAYRELAMDRAIFFWQRAMDKDPRNPQLRYNLAQAFESIGDIDEAAEQYQAALQLNPDLVSPRFNLAVLNRQRGDLKKAEELLQEAVEHAPFFTGGHLLLGKIHQQEGNDDRAIEEYLKVINLGPQGSYDLGEVYFELGNLYFRKGRLQQAKEAWTKTLQINPDHQQAQENLDRLS